MRYLLAIAAVTTSVFVSLPSQAGIISKTTVPLTAPSKVTRTIEQAGTTETSPVSGSKGQAIGVKSAPIEPVTIRFPTKK